MLGEIYVSGFSNPELLLLNKAPSYKFTSLYVIIHIKTALILMFLPLVETVDGQWIQSANRNTEAIHLTDYIHQTIDWHIETPLLL